jgi:hypothetical protein
MNNFEKMLSWCLDGVIQFHQEGKGEFNDQAVEELRVIKDSVKSMEVIKAYWNALSYGDYNGRDMLGWKVVDEIFEDTVKRYPEITRVLKVYMYS